MEITVSPEEAKKVEAAILKAKAAGFSEDEIKESLQRKYGNARAVEPVKPIDPTEGMTGMEKFLAGTGKAFVDVGRGVGQVAGDVAEGVGMDRPKWAPTQSDIEESRQRDAPLMNTGAGLAGNVFGNVAGLAPLALVPGANTIGGGVALGALTGAIQPVGQNDSRTGNVAMGGVAGGALPVAGRVLKVGKAALIDPFTEAGKQRIVGATVNRAAGDKQAAMANLLRSKGATPGFNPTAGQASGDAGIASLERAASAIDPGGFQAVKQDQTAALVNALRGVAGSPESRQAAIDAREHATNALYDQAKNAVVADDGALSALLKRPSMSAAMDRASRIAKERGEFPSAIRAAPTLSRQVDVNRDNIIDAVRKLGGISQDSFDQMFGQSVRNDFKFAPSLSGPVFAKGNGLGVDEIARELYQKGYLPEDDVHMLLDSLVDTHMFDKPAYSVFKQETTNDPLSDAINSLVAKMSEKQRAQAETPNLLQNGKISGKALHDLKMGLDDAIGVPGQGGMMGAERSAAMGTKSDFLNWLENKIPEYGQARTTYADLSKPINQMDIGQELYKRFVPALADTGGVPFKSRADAYAQALRNGDQLARSVTGMKGATLEGTMTPEQLATLHGIASDASMKAAAESAGRGVGSDTVQKMAMSNLMNQAGIPNWMQSIGRVPGGWLRTVGDLLYTKNDQALQSALAEIIKDPQATAQAMQMAKTDPGAFMQAMQKLTQGVALSLPSAVNANQQ